MNVISLAYRLKREMKKDISYKTKVLDKKYDEYGVPIETLTPEVLQNIRDTKLNEFKETYELACDLMLIMQDVNESKRLTAKSKQCYFITVRPKCSEITFDDFYELVSAFTKRKCFNSFKLTFEQKGTTNETLGHGFHIHIVAHMTQRSKTEVLRDTQNTFKHCTAGNCIQVDLCKNPEEHFKKYCIDYLSNDNHKMVTKEWDSLWRKNNNLLNYYDGEVALCGPIKSVSGPIIIEMN